MTSIMHNSKRFIAFVLVGMLCASTTIAFNSAKMVGENIAYSINKITSFCKTDTVIPTAIVSGFFFIVGSCIAYDYWKNNSPNSFYQCISSHKPEFFAGSVVLGGLTCGLLYKTRGWFSRVYKSYGDTQDLLVQSEDDDLC